MLYQFLIYLRVASVLGFFLFHGATASATYGLKRERGADQVELLPSVVDGSFQPAHLSIWLRRPESRPSSGARSLHVGALMIYNSTESPNYMKVSHK